ncbi:MAG: type II toxin-antitoxin system HicA family toxin [Chloroflexota bacterium]|nr:type II toxin-antitoxin system HicA family toxin [Chloroflexota bacterium]MDQ5867708.1 type II toxin-antitoxin system HicA family toxin [Chloroflexota bacterium]
MPRKIRELKADLRKSGFGYRPGKGSHTIWYHDMIPNEIILSGNDGDDAKPYQERLVRGILDKLAEAQRRH